MAAKWWWGSGGKVGRRKELLSWFYGEGAPELILASALCLSSSRLGFTQGQAGTSSTGTGRLAAQLQVRHTTLTQPPLRNSSPAVPATTPSLSASSPPRSLLVTPPHWPRSLSRLFQSSAFTTYAMMLSSETHSISTFAMAQMPATGHHRPRCRHSQQNPQVQTPASTNDTEVPMS